MRPKGRGPTVMHAADYIKHKYSLGSRGALGWESWEEFSTL